MRYQIKTRVAAVASCLFWAMIFVPVINAQEKPEITAANARANHHHLQAAGTRSSRKVEKFPEFEVVASDQFRSAGIVAPLSSRLNIEGYYFGVRIESGLEERLEHAAKRRSGFLDLGAITGSYGSRLGSAVSSVKPRRLPRPSLFAGRSRRAGFFRKGCSSSHCRRPRSLGVCAFGTAITSVCV